MLHAVIMAGGAGTRFWPASRVQRPKQLLDLAGPRTMIQETVDRLGEQLVDSQRILIVTNQLLVEPIREQLPELSSGAILGEPCKRDTAPCIGLAALAVRHQDPAATMAVMPADHVIQPAQRFQEAIQFAADLVEQQPSRIVTFGVRPTYPAETFGYIQRGRSLAAPAPQLPLFAVEQFREKPDAATARDYLESGNFYWNSGIFVWKASTILDALREFEPQMAAHLEQIGEAMGSDSFAPVLQREFSAMTGKSIDYAVLERYPDVVVVEAPFQWDDLGNWPAMARLRGSDRDGNTVLGKHLGIDTQDSIVRSAEDHLVVTVGLRDCIVVHTPDATLIAKKENEESIRQVVQRLEQLGWTEYL